MLAIRRKVLTEREDRKRRKALVKYEKMFKELEGVTIFWPEVGVLMFFVAEGVKFANLETVSDRIY